MQRSHRGNGAAVFLTGMLGLCHWFETSQWLQHIRCRIHHVRACERSDMNAVDENIAVRGVTGSGCALFVTLMYHCMPKGQRWSGMMTLCMAWSAWVNMATTGVSVE